ncbi:hypothetical protein NDU88_002747 [Pleurodeles waltl]|uniref:Uncharacterized protein n=1 Tax=Pleurodeles waltl TaxID=8319 RepID=A0AAV7WRK2_PLEWA|nr:hypothetical protein NDU88_002747 [Pleurodeles waltl]
MARVYSLFRSSAQVRRLALLWRFETSPFVRNTNGTEATSSDRLRELLVALDERPNHETTGAPFHAALPRWETPEGGHQRKIEAAGAAIIRSGGGEIPVLPTRTLIDRGKFKSAGPGELSGRLGAHSHHRAPETLSPATRSRRELPGRGNQENVRIIGGEISKGDGDRNPHLPIKAQVGRKRRRAAERGSCSGRPARVWLACRLRRPS